MVGGVLLFAGFEFAKLVQPGEAAFDKPTGFAQAAAVGGSTLGEQRLYPLFLISRRCGSES
jgi:hypothetical protein